MSNALAGTTGTTARALNASIGAHDGRWVQVREVENLLATVQIAGTLAERKLLAGALRNGRLRLTPKAEKLVARKYAMPGERPALALACLLHERA